MFYDADEPGFEPGHYDLLIVGSGPSGISLATELADSGLRIAVLESGKITKEDYADALRTVESVGIPIRETSRERIFGGATATWAALSAPFDDIDFEHRPQSPLPGWPFLAPDLSPYLQAAADRYAFPSPSLFVPADSLSQFRRLTPKVFLRPKRDQMRFGRKYRYIFDQDGIDLIVGATVTRIQTSPGDSQRADGVICASATGRSRVVHADTIVLAAGGLENPRILLYSDIGNASDQVGRYLMNHPKGNVGMISFLRRMPYDWSPFNLSMPDFVGYAGIRLSDVLQRKEGLLNPYVRIEPVYPWDGHRALTNIRASAVALIAIARSLQQRQLRPVWRQALVLAKAAIFALVSIPSLCVLFVRALPYAVRPGVRTARVRCFVEMEPESTNRVVLSRETDRFGVPVPRVSHMPSPLALRSLQRLLEVLDAECQEAGIGRYVPERGALAEFIQADASHHLGATRMGDDPRTSVVDPHLRVHSMRNVFVTGGSVFPTGGNANPTLLMVALSIRLAEHLKSVMNARKPELPDTSLKNNVIIIGAGRRVCEDVVRVLELAPSFAIQGIFARRSGSVFSRRCRYEVRPVTELNQEALLAARFVYVAVPPAEVLRVLKELTAFELRSLQLILDTPAQPIPRDIREKFSAIHVAEDSVLLPWLSLLKETEAELGRMTHIECDRSVMGYHGVALLKVLMSRSARTAGFRMTRAVRRRTSIDLEVPGLTATIRMPRDYARGTFRVEYEHGCVSERPEPSRDVIEMMKEGERCVGFRIRDAVARLSSTESELVGRCRESDTIITKMLDLKRVGLLRMFAGLKEGTSAWSLEDALDDAQIDGTSRMIPVASSSERIHGVTGASPRLVRK